MNTTPETFRVLSNSEKSSLKLFCSICDEIHSCRFVLAVNSMDHTITIDRDPTKNRIPRYDKDDFRSFATLFRKLDANDEPTYIFKVMKILKRFASTEDQYTFKEIKALLLQEAEQPSFAIAIGPPGAEVDYSPKKIRNVIFNGHIFHSAPDLQNDVARVLDFEPFVMTAFLRYASILVNVATRYAHAIRHLKLIDEV